MTHMRAGKSSPAVISLPFLYAVRLLFGARTLTVAGASSGNTVELVQLDDVVDFLRMSRPGGLAGELGQAAVQGVLSTLKAWTGRPAPAGLLSAHAKATGGPLPRRDATSLAGLGLAGPRGRLEIVKSELEVFHVVDQSLVGLSSLPVEDLHCEAGRGGGDRRQGPCTWNEGIGICV
jgi:hypothetical protein